MRAMDCADYIVDMAIEHDLDITNLQLQKILYLFASEYQKECDEYPFDVDFQAWAYGPVIPEVYFEYKKYGSSNIKEYSKHQQVDVETFKITTHEYIEQDIDDRFKRIVNDFLQRLLDINIFKIVDFTHNQTFWKENETKIYRRFSLDYPQECVKFNRYGLQELIDRQFDVEDM